MTAWRLFQLTAVVGLVSWVCLAEPALAAGVRLGNDETFAQLGLLLQARTDLLEAGAPTGRDVGVDLYLRRARLLFFGQLTPRVTFFVDTDNPNLGKGGDTSSGMYLQDAFVELDLHPALQLDAGLLLLPFSHHGMTGATSLLLIDYHTAMLRYPTGSHRIWRDVGVMIRGLLFAELVEYRLAVTNGVQGSTTTRERESSDGASHWTERVDPRNRRDRPRVTGRLAVNLFAPTTGRGAVASFTRGIQLIRSDGALHLPSPVFTLGVSVDWQDDLNVLWAPPVDGAPRRVARRSDYLALAVDLFADLPLTGDGRAGLTGQAAIYRYHHDAGRRRAPGEERFLPAGVANPSGTATMAEVGLRYEALALLIAGDWFVADRAAADTADLLALYGGPAWWWRGHELNVKLQLGASRIGRSPEGGTPWIFAGSLQAQLLF